MKKEIEVKGNKIIVSTDGRIFDEYGKEKTQFENSSGYLYVVFFNKEHKRNNFLIHRLVAEAFLENKKGLPYVNHKDENTKNNVLSNLEYCTPRYNNLYHDKPKRILISLVSRGRTVRTNLYKDNRLIRSFISIRSACKYTGANSIKVSCGIKENGGLFEFDGYVYEALNKAYKGSAKSRYVYSRKTKEISKGPNEKEKNLIAPEMTEKNFLGAFISGEVWKPIIGYNDTYYISNLGRVATNFGRNGYYRIKYINKDKNGYMNCRLYKDGKCKNFLVHRLVAQYFVKNSDKEFLTVVHHKDHNRSNNQYSNLMWVTQEENSIESVVHKFGEFKDYRNKFNKNYCKECGKEISHGSNYCKKHSYIARAHNYKIRELGKEEIEMSLKRTKGNFTKSSREFSMTDNALRKWCRKYGLGSHSIDWK